MQKKSLTAPLGGHPARLDLLKEKILSEISAMDYRITTESCEDGFIIDISKDIGGIDTALGRWQHSQIKIIKIFGYNDAIHMDIIKHAYADKIICALIGPLFFGIPWIFGLIATANRKNIEKVICKLITDHATKNRLS